VSATSRDPAGDLAGESALRIEDAPERRRYEAHIDDQLVGWVDYGRVGSRLVALHTEVPPEFGGRGIGSALVRRVIAEARAVGFQITPRCPMFVRHFERHPEDADVVAHPRAG
jgi:predicted GNAT family acetyltransferase